jgi:hypothetical protein
MLLTDIIIEAEIEENKRVFSLKEIFQDSGVYEVVQEPRVFLITFDSKNGICVNKNGTVETIHKPVWQDKTFTKSDKTITIDFCNEDD